MLAVVPVFPNLVAAPFTPLYPTVGLGSLDRLAAPAVANPFQAYEQQSMQQTLSLLVGMLANLMTTPPPAQTEGTASTNGASTSTSTANLPSGEGAGVQKFLKVATDKQGSPYVFGAEGNGQYDCSGLVYASLKEAGVNVPRLTAAGYQDMFKDTKVDRNNLKPGDLLFFHSKNDRGIPDGKATHIEIYLGNGMSMGTDSPKEGAKIEPVDWNSFIGGARVPQLSQ